MFRRMYLTLFHAVTDALNEMETQNFVEARQLLMQAQIDCEEIYIQAGETTHDNIIVLETTES